MAFPSKIEWWLVVRVVAVPAWTIVTRWSERSTPPAALWVTIAVIVIVGAALVHNIRHVGLQQ
jgi:hypothetical protein